MASKLEMIELLKGKTFRSQPQLLLVVEHAPWTEMMNQHLQLNFESKKLIDNRALYFFPFSFTCMDFTLGGDYMNE